MHKFCTHSQGGAAFKTLCSFVFSSLNLAEDFCEVHHVRGRAEGNMPHIGLGNLPETMLSGSALACQTVEQEAILLLL